MVQIDVLLHGIPGRSNQGYLGQASAALLDERTIIDVGSLARRPLLEASFRNVSVEPEDIENVLLTHVHFDHCDNVDLFSNATVYVYEHEMERIRNGEMDWATPPHAEALLSNLDIELFAVDDEVAGLDVIPAPGHTEHHVAFILEDGMTYGFTGDAVKNTRELTTMDPMVLYDKQAAIDTLQRVRDSVDFVIPGHDTPFYIDNGSLVPTIDVDFGVNLQLSPTSATTTEIVSNRTQLRELPETVTDCTARQEFH